MLSQSSALSKVALSLSLVALVTHIIGFASPYWLTGEIYIPGFGQNSMNIGLFKGCSTLEGCQRGSNPKQWQLISAGLAVAGLVLALITAFALVLHVFVLASKPWVKKFKAASTGVTILAGIFIIAGCAVVTINRDDVNDRLNGFVFDVAWAFALSVVGGILFVVVGVVLIVDAIF